MFRDSLTKQESETVTAWLRDRLDELKPEARDLRVEQPGLLSGIRKLIRDLSKAEKSR